MSGRGPGVAVASALDEEVAVDGEVGEEDEESRV